MAIFEVIKKNKDDNYIVSRYPKRNFNTGSKLIVNESEEAIFYSLGKALDLFGPGKYTLETGNIPLLKALINIPTGGKSAFTCDVYFIDKTIQNYRWGTPSKIEFLEPVYNFPIQIGACGEIRFQIDDSRKFITKLVGIKKNFDNESIEDFFSSQILVKLKTYLTNLIKEEKISIFEIDSKLESISDSLKEKLENDFDEFGIKLEKFFVTNIAKPEDDKQYLEFKELYFKKGVGIARAQVDKELTTIESEKEALKTTIEASAKAEAREKQGYTYQEEKEYDIKGKWAENEAVGQFNNIGVGLGMISGMSENVSKTVNGAFTDINSNNNLFCKYCGKKLESDSVFCSGCGKKVN